MPTSRHARLEKPDKLGISWELGFLGVGSFSLAWLGFSSQRPEPLRGPAMLRRGLVRRCDADEQPFIEGTANEIDANREPGRNRTDQARAFAFARAVPYLGREARGHRDHRKALLPEHGPADRRSSVDRRLARRGELA